MEVSVETQGTRLRRQRAVLAVVRAAAFTAVGLAGCLEMTPQRSAEEARAQAIVVSATALLRGHLDWVGSAAFSPDGTQVVTVSGDEAWVWRADGTGAPVVLRGHEGNVLSAAFRPDGTQVVTASGDSTARVWRADGTGAPVVEIQVPSAWAAPAGLSDFWLYPSFPNSVST